MILFLEQKKTPNFGRNFRPTEISVHHYYQYPEQKEYHSILRIRYRHKKGEQNADNSFCATFQATMLLDFVHPRLCFFAIIKNKSMYMAWCLKIMYLKNSFKENILLKSHVSDAQLKNSGESGQDFFRHKRILLALALP